MRTLASLFIAVVALTLLSFDVPEGWYRAGSKPKSYKMELEKGAGHNGGNAAIIASTDKKINGFGTLMQSALPGKYVGKRVKMTGWIKAENVAHWAGMWMRVDQAGKNKPLSFDNMESRPIKGSADWKQYEIILDVPMNASNLAYGVLIDGTGKVWFDDVQFEIVDNKTPVTGKNTKYWYPADEPVNLNFED